MPTIDEDASDGLSLAGERGPSDWTSRACEHFSLSEVVALSKDDDISELGFTLGAEGAVVFSSDVSAGFTLAGAVSGGVVATDVIASSLSIGGDRAASPVATDAEETIEIEAVAVADAYHQVGVSFTISEAVSGGRQVNASATEGISLGAGVQSLGPVDALGEDIELDAATAHVVTHGVTAGLTLAAAATEQRVATTNAAESFALSATSAQVLAAQGLVTERFSLRAIGSPVDPDAPVLWANSKRMASAVWKGLPFDSFVIHRGELIAAGPAGLYRFTGTNDDGDPIAVRVVTDLTDLGSEKKKVFDSVQMSGTSSGPLAVTVETEMGKFRYRTDRDAATYPVTHRAGLGRGITGRYVRFTLDNAVPDHVGANFSMEDVNVIAGDSQRVR